MSDGLKDFICSMTISAIVFSLFGLGLDLLDFESKVKARLRAIVGCKAIIDELSKK